MRKNDQGEHPNQFLRQAREQRAWSQARLAQELGVSRKTVSRWERGTALPYPHSREQLCQIFGKSVAALGLLQEDAHEEPEGTLHPPLSEAITTTFSVPGSFPSDQAASFPFSWHVPYRRNALFTGREDIFERLHETFVAGRVADQIVTQAISGLAGVGKTQTALEYAYRHALDYHAVFWMGAETEALLVSGLLRVAEALQLPERDDKDQQRVIAAVQRWLATHDQWLLIWDNVEDIELLDRYLPTTGSGAVLITTRWQVLGTLARGIDLVPMEAEEGVLFLLRRAKILSPEATHEQLQQFAEQMPAHYAAAVDLVSTLGGLPLALDQAGAYLEAIQCGIPAYLDLFRTRRTALLKLRGEDSPDYPASVPTTLTLALKTTTGQHPVVGDLLRVCAFLQPDVIPEELFQQAADHLGVPLQAVRRDLLEWDRVVSVACSYSLLARHAEQHTLSIHRLVQAVLLESMAEAERKQWSKRVIDALDALFPEIWPATEYRQRKQYERLLPHALHCLRQVGSAEESLTLASLAYKTAQVLLARARYGEAEALYLRASHTREQALGPDHLDVASALHGLGALYQKQGKYAEAEPLYLRALQITERVLGPDHVEVARLLNELGNLYLAQGKYRETEPFYLKALYIGEQVLGPAHPNVATTLSNLVYVYYEQGRYAEAETLGLRALHIREQALGPDHPQVANSLTSLGDLYKRQDRSTEAEACFLRALHIREQAQGPDHPDVAYPLNNLAELYREQGRYVEVEPLSLRALQIWEQTLGPLHPLVAHPFTNLANLRREQGRDGEAEAFYQRALSIREQQLGSQHPETAETLYGLALLRQKQGQRNEALSLAKRALSICSQALGEAHPQTVAARALYEQLLQEQTGTEEIAAQKLSQEFPTPRDEEQRESH